MSSIYSELGVRVPLASSSSSSSNNEMRRALEMHKSSLTSARYDELTDTLSRFREKPELQTAYNLFGPGVLRCVVCVSKEDYLLYDAVNILTAFVGFVPVCLLATTRWDTAYLRWWTLGAAALWFAAESLDATRFLAPLAAASCNWTQAQLDLALRHIVLAVLAVGPLLLPTNTVAHNAHALAIAMIAHSGESNARLDRLLLSRAASQRPL